jgi:hypothetical protein
MTSSCRAQGAPETWGNFSVPRAAGVSRAGQAPPPGDQAPSPAAAAPRATHAHATRTCDCTPLEQEDDRAR